ncbi:hypothetical protein Bca52824_018957 [Brassica carinata]|uniref:Arf-GAP domain-containing protein n=1 Tax=Brassica carinata TaxID=52824 RepID=A0A8X8AY16_BRACI|nr:hypothetical protein Bca52824_018957 [Brassica carinata]
MNGKASVSKELNAKHTKGTKMARWANVNLEIFICMQCAGIHRSLGVRSITLDTWLPDQVVFMQSTGYNAKANQCWESELPPHFQRSSSDAFIRAKYWILFHAKKVFFAVAAFFICCNTILSLNLCLRYYEKKWGLPGGIQPTPTLNQLSWKVGHLVERGYKHETPMKAITLSLDEDLLLKHVTHKLFSRSYINM